MRSTGQAFQIEKKGGKADIMRLTFKTDAQYIESLARRPNATKELIETYLDEFFYDQTKKVADFRWNVLREGLLKNWA